MLCAERRGEQWLAAQKGAAKNAQKADRHAANVLHIIRQIAAGGVSLRRLANELNTRGTKPRRAVCGMRGNALREYSTNAIKGANGPSVAFNRMGASCNWRQDRH